MPKEILLDPPCFQTLKSRHPEVKCFIFDMDGTLFDSEKTHSLAVGKLLENHGHQDICVHWVEDTFAGMADHDVYHELIATNKLASNKISKKQFIDQKNQAFAEILPKIQRSELLHPKIETFLQMAKEENFKTALVTASEKFVTEIMLKHIDISHLFDTIKTREDFSETKPHPMPYIQTMKQLELTPDQVIIFEDSVTGLQSALSSGAIVYQAKWHANEKKK